MAAGMLVLTMLLATTPGAGEPWQMKERNLRIPIKVDPARRNQIKELRLFSSSDQGQSWQQVAVAHPDQDGFQFNAPADGEYWFSVCVVDQQGRRDPEDVYKAGPSQKIIIDTLKPVVRIVSAERQGTEVQTAWEIQEEHPDLASLRLEYRPADAPANVWYSAPVSPALSGQTKFTVTSASAIALRLQIQDQAGNVGSAAADVAAAPNLQTAAAVPNGQPAPTMAAAPPPVSNAIPGPTAPAPAPGAAPLSGSPYEQGRPTQTMPLVNEPRPAPEYYPPPASSNYPMASGSSSDPNLRQVLATSDNAATFAASAGGIGSARSARGQLPPVLITNNKIIKLDYEVKTGPSGVGKVDLYMTRDDGRTWQWFAEDADRKSPIEAELPGEGVYGFSLVVQNGAGVGKRQPISGDPPEMRVELDTTPPTAQLYAPQPNPQQRDAIILSWSASDRNLTATPITLEWAAERDGNWNLIRNNLPNSGSMSWKLPDSGLPPRVYLRLTAIDAAGNTGVAVTQESVCLDLKEPEGHLLGLVGGIRRP